MTDSKYFFCQELEIQLYRPLCVRWQQQAKEAKVLKKYQEKCLDCEQGRGIAAEVGQTTDNRLQMTEDGPARLY